MRRSVQVAFTRTPSVEFDLRLLGGNMTSLPFLEDWLQGSVSVESMGAIGLWKSRLSAQLCRLLCARLRAGGVHAHALGGVRPAPAGRQHDQPALPGGLAPGERVR